MSTNPYEIPEIPLTTRGRALKRGRVDPPLEVPSQPAATFNPPPPTLSGVAAPPLAPPIPFTASIHSTRFSLRTFPRRDVSSQGASSGGGGGGGTELVEVALPPRRRGVLSTQGKAAPPALAPPSSMGVGSTSIIKHPQYITRRSSSALGATAIRGPLKLEGLSVVKAPPVLSSADPLPPAPPAPPPINPHTTRKRQLEQVKSEVVIKECAEKPKVVTKRSILNNPSSSAAPTAIPPPQLQPTTTTTIASSASAFASAPRFVPASAPSLSVPAQRLEGVEGLFSGQQQQQQQPSVVVAPTLAPLPPTPRGAFPPTIPAAQWLRGHGEERGRSSAVHFPPPYPIPNGSSAPFLVDTALRFLRVPSLVEGVERGEIERVGGLPDTWVEEGAVGWRGVLVGGQDCLFLTPLPASSTPTIVGVGEKEKGGVSEALESQAPGGRFHYQLAPPKSTGDRAGYDKILPTLTKAQGVGMYQDWYQVVPLPPFAVHHMTLAMARLLASAQAGALDPALECGGAEALRISPYAWLGIIDFRDPATLTSASTPAINAKDLRPPNPYTLATIVPASSPPTTHASFYSASSPSASSSSAAAGAGGGVAPPPPTSSSSSSSSSAPSLANAGIVRYADSAFTLALVPHSTPPHLLPSIYSLRYSLPPIKAAVALSLLLSADVPSGSTSVAAHRTDPGFNSFFSHYGKSTLEFLSQRARHPDFFVPPDAMLGEVTVRMRAILVDWMWYVHIKYRLNSETMHLAASIVDRYLARAPVARSHLQLLGVTALLLASKHEECWCPDVDALVKIMDGAYSSRQVLAMEITVLRTLNFIISAPTPYHFLIHALRCLGTDERSYLGKCATALLDRSLQESDLWLGHLGADWEGSAYLQPPSDSSSSASASASCKGSGSGNGSGSGSGSGGSRGSYGGAQQPYQQRMGVTPQFIALSALSGALLALGGPREYEAGDRQVSSLVMGSVPISVSGGGGGRSYARIPWQVPRSVCRILGCGSKGEIVRAREVGYRMLGLFHKWDSLGYQEGAIAAFTVCSYPGNTSKSQITAVMKKYSHYRHGAVALLLSASYPLLKLTREHFEDVEGEVAV